MSCIVSSDHQINRSSDQHITKSEQPPKTLCCWQHINTINYPASENPNLVRCLLGGVQDDTVGRRYRRAEIERGEADAIQENGDPERMGYMNIELWNKPRFKYQ
jgi:hypothetical protein